MAGQPKSHLSQLIELVVIVVVALGLAWGIQAFLVKPYKIPSESMEPTLVKGQRVLVSRISMDLGKPSVGDIVVFHPPADAELQLCGPNAHAAISGGAPCAAPIPKEDLKTNFIKRVIAGPGDELYISRGHAYRCPAKPGRSRCASGEFKREADSYINPSCGPNGELSGCNFPTPITVPAGHWFMMGDNRGRSDDSRYWGPVPTSWIIGPAFATYWPLSRIGTL